MQLEKIHAKLLTCLLLGALGFAGNWLKFGIFFDIDFLWGSIFTMLAILWLGKPYGVITGFIAASCTYLLWNHPWAIVIMTGEAFFVSWLFPKRLRNLLLCDLLYWLALGAPMIFLFYHGFMDTPLKSTVLVMFKQSINGISNALAAILIYRLIQVYLTRKKGIVPFEELLFTTMISLVILPSLVFLFADLKREQWKGEQALAEEVSHRSEDACQSLTFWMDEHLESLQTLAELIGDPDAHTVAEIQHLVEMIEAASPAFLRMGVVNRDGIAIASSPIGDEAGVSALGLDLSTSPSVLIIQETMRPYVSDTIMGRINATVPIIPMLAPLVSGGEYRGFCSGVLDLSRIKQVLAGVARDSSLNITLLDRNRKVIATTRADLKVVEEFHPFPGIVTPLAGKDTYQWTPNARPGAAPMQRWRESLFVKEQRLSPAMDWLVITESSFQDEFVFLTRQMVQNFMALSLLILFTVVLAYLASRKLSRRLEDLRETTSLLPHRLSETSLIHWPESRIAEVHELGGNFRQMAISLAESFEKQSALNKQLIDAQHIGQMGSWEIDVSTGEIVCSDEIYSIYEIAAPGEKISRELLREAVHPKDRYGVEQLDTLLSGENACINTEYRLLMRDGRVKYVHERREPCLAEGEVLRRIMGTVQDVTDIRRAQEALRVSEEKFRTLFDHAADAMFIQDLEGRFLAGNHTAYQWLGYDQDELLRMSMEDILSEGFESSFQLYTKGPSRFDGVVFEAAHVAKGGRIIPVELHCRSLSFGGEPAVMTIARDLTARKQAEEERARLEQRLQQAEKAESLGRMAGAIAHNFNNMLGAVLGNLEMALDEASQGSELETCITEAMTASRRAAEISRFMLTYLGQTTGKAVPVDFVGVIREACSLLSPSLPRNVHLKASTLSSGPIITADGAHLTQILTNMISNAAEAIGEREGEISLSVDVVSRAQFGTLQLFPLDWEPITEAYACLSIADTGCGIEPENLDKIFDPFFTTKFAGRGLGLPVVLGLLRTLGGAVSVDGHPKRGATFKLFFPISEQAPLAPSRSEGMMGGVAKAGGLVLVVDDEAMARNMAESILKKKLGFEVVTAADGHEALKLFSERSDEFTLVLLDLSMPGMNGRETLSALRAIRSDIPVILASGYDEAQVMRDCLPEQLHVFLHKPYGASDLKVALAAAIGLE